MSIDSDINVLIAATTALTTAIGQLTVEAVPANATSVAYGNSTVSAALDQLLYIPVSISSYTITGSNPVEIGSSVSNVILSWVTNKTMTGQTINGAAISPTATTITEAGPYISTTSWTLGVTDGNTSATSTQTLSFLSKRYWGNSSTSSVSGSQMLAASSDLVNSRQKTISYNTTGGSYPFYCYPASLGSLSAVTVGGLSFSDYSVSTVAFTNASGYTTNYNIAIFNTIQNGSNITVAWS